MARAEEQIRTSTVVEILKGMPSPTVRRFHYNELKTFGAGKDISTQDWQDYLLQMLHMGFIEIAYDQQNVVKITQQGWQVLRGEMKVQMAVIDRNTKENRPRKKRDLRLEIPSIHIPGIEKPEGVEDPKLFEALRALRKQLADAQGFPAYIVLSDKVLHSLATIKPVTVEEFGMVSGIGDFKKQKYGETFTELIRRYK